MAWITSAGGRLEPDGQPFEDPRDSFERVWNAYLAEHGGPPEPEEIDTSNGWPYTTLAGTVRPASKTEIRRMLDVFFNPWSQEKALDAGNTHEELDIIARSLLAWAADFAISIWDSERCVAERLGVDVSACPRLDDGRIRHRV